MMFRGGTSMLVVLGGVSIFRVRGGTDDGGLFRKERN